MNEELPPPSIGAVLTYMRIMLPRTGLNPRRQTVAWTITSHYNYREGCCRPTYATLAKEMNLSEDTIWRSVRAINATGIWKVKPGNGRGHATEYRFPLAGPMVLVEDPEELSTRSATTADLVGRERSAESTVKVRGTTEERSASVADPTETASTETKQLGVPDAADDDEAPAAPTLPKSASAHGFNVRDWAERQRQRLAL